MKRRAVFMFPMTALLQLRRERAGILNIQVVFFTLIITLTFCPPALSSLQYVEDFQDDYNPSQADLASSIFNHNFLQIPGTDRMYWSFSISPWDPEDYNLFLAPAMDEITFSLPQGQYVESVSISFCGSSATKPATFEVIGEQGTYSAQAQRCCKWADTSGTDIGPITMVRLSCEMIGEFDDLTINVVPEPATILLLGFGAMLLRKRR